MTMFANRFGVTAFFVLFLMLISALACKKPAKEPVVSSAESDQIRIESKDPDPKSMVVSSVNGSGITMSALVREMNRIAGLYYKPGETASADMDKKIKHDALEHLIFRELAIQEAVRQGMVVKPERIDEVVRQVQAGVGSGQAFQDYLADRGLTEKQLRHEIARSHLFEMITAQEVYGHLIIDDKSLIDRFERQKHRFMSRDNPPRRLSFEEVKDFLKREVKAEQGAEKMKEWEKKLRGKAVIHISREDANVHTSVEGSLDRKKL